MHLDLTLTSAGKAQNRRLFNSFCQVAGITGESSDVARFGASRVHGPRGCRPCSDGRFRVLGVARLRTVRRDLGLARPLQPCGAVMRAELRHWDRASDREKVLSRPYSRAAMGPRVGRNPAPRGAFVECILLPYISTC